MPHILVVDDEPEITKLVSKIMESRGHRVSVARDGEEAIARVAEDRPDVIVLDLNLPKLDGVEVCRRIKGDAQTRRIPIVMMTAAYVGVDDAARGFDAGADEYIVKPFLREVLIHNVERLIADSTGKA